MFIKAIKNQRGDTIIEVMIALSVLMVIIVGGYSIATRSLNGVRIAQERSEASKIAEGQLEAINERIAAAGGNFSVVSDTTSPRGSFARDDFCINDSGNAVNNSDAACTISNLYRIKIDTDDTAVIDSVTNQKNFKYSVVVTWDKSGGGTQERVEMVGRFVLK